MTNRTLHPLIWLFNQDDGFYYAEGFYQGIFKIIPITIALSGREPSTSFKIVQQIDEHDAYTDIGMCLSLSNAKQVCDLLENG